MQSNGKLLASKAQKRTGADSIIVTIPSTIKFIMDIEPGDTIEFYISDDKRVCIRNKKQQNDDRARNE